MTDVPASPATGWGRFGPDSVERAMLLRLSDVIGVQLRPRSLVVQGARTELEGVDVDDSVLVQVVGNSGQFRSQHRNKVMADMFKLTWLRASAFPAARLVMCVSATVAQTFTSTAWVTVAARDLRVEVWVDDGSRVRPLGDS
jgi:hypothetical protein